MSVSPTISITGLGYVGLPLAVEFAKKYKVIGFDIDSVRLAELSRGYDKTREVEKSVLENLPNLHLTSSLQGLKEASIHIVTVPTLIDIHKQPDLQPFKKATQDVAKILKKGDTVVYESTVYPGCTEEVAVPILEEISGLAFNRDFFVGYSPERINPGDKVRTVSKIKKVVAGSTPETAKEVNALYQSIIEAGTYMTSSIKVAEAAKVIENTQRDINIAFVNELALIFGLLGIDTGEVLDAASTKWNFFPFRPGLVGGHCIGVDPYYLTYKAESLGYNPEIILAGRRINDEMGKYVVKKMVKMMMKKTGISFGTRVLVLGITFKENCPDVRNSKVVDIIRELEDYGILVDVYDDNADSKEVQRIYGIALKEYEDLKKVDYSGVVVAVAHDSFKRMEHDFLFKKETVIYDVKGIWDRERVDYRL